MEAELFKKLPIFCTQLNL